MAYLEAVNDGSFHGSAMKRFLEGHEEDKKKMLDEKVSNFFGHLNPVHSHHQHEAQEAEEKRMADVDPSAGWKSIHRRERPGSIYPGSKLPAPRRGGVDLGEAEEGESHEYLTWRWFPTWQALRTHHVYEIGNSSMGKIVYILADCYPALSRLHCLLHPAFWRYSVLLVWPRLPPRDQQ